MAKAMATKTKQPEKVEHQPQLVALADIRLDDMTQSRTMNNQELVEHYAELMRDGVDMPPVDLFTPADGPARGEYFIGDGIHRCHAHVAAELDEVWAIVHTGGLKEAQVFACGANKTHGLHRTNSDKRRAAEIMLRLEPRWSNRKIAEHVGVSDMMVADVRRGLESAEKIEKTETRVGKDGRSYVKPHVQDSCSRADDDEPDEDDYENPFGPPTVPAADDFDPEAIEGEDHGLDLDTYNDHKKDLINALNAYLRKEEQMTQHHRYGLHASLQWTRRQKDASELKADVAGDLATAICDACEGAGCKSCGNAGFITKAIQQRRG